MLRPRAVLLSVLLFAGAGVLAGCSSTVALEPPTDANDPRCADVMVRLPEVFEDHERRWTDAQSTASWGDPSAVIIACGVTPPGPSTLPCQTVSGIDWIIDDTEAPMYRLTTYGRVPAIEILVDNDIASSSGPVDTVSRLITDEFDVESQCTTLDEATPVPDAP
ncbi:hypothetical protein BKA24_001873 [Microbacterium marinum]|uniref:DUF3515 domain-containing protein n=1 Tax=Microbacterium marinum TaxID=421115 RepID=A0A7W7FL89_9MICO|nr:DUF3515 family protein [Microbacterium marinum]MBB4667164.1 hypothetical protein [Microbacterium marinum]